MVPDDGESRERVAFYVYKTEHEGDEKNRTNNTKNGASSHTRAFAGVVHCVVDHARK